MKTFVRTIAVLVLTVSSLSARSQAAYMFHKSWYLTGQVGVSSFYGDLSDKKNRMFSDSPFSKFYYDDRGLVVSAQYGKDINAFVSAGLNFSGGELRGTSELLGMYMTSRFYEYGLHTKINTLNILLGPSRYRPVELYGMLGVGGISHRTYARDLLTDTLVGINDPENPGVFSGTYLTSSTVLLSYGFGVRYQVSESVSLSFESTTHAVLNDRLDAHISDKRSFEGYSKMNLGLTYHFDMSPYAFRSAYPKYNGKSNDPAIKKYNKQKQVVMDTKASRQASKKRYDTRKGRTKITFRNMFRRNKLVFAK